MPARTPEDVDHLFGEYMNAGDLDAIVSLYEPGATLVEQHGDAVGTAAIREALAAILSTKLQISMNVYKVARGGDDIAMLYNDWHATVPGQDVSLSGKAIEIVRRQPDGTWLFAIDDPYARR